MKKFLAFSVAVLTATGLALADTETVYLKNGSILRGEIIEQVPGKSIKLQTKDGNIWVYSVDEIEKITKEGKSSAASNGGDAGCNIRHSKLDFNISTGYDIATSKGGSGMIPVDFIASKRFSPNFDLGIGVGMHITPESNAKPIIPVFVSAKGFFPLSSSKITPFAEVRAGYAFNTAEDKTYSVGSGKNRITTTIEMPDYVLFSIMPGVRFPLSRCTDVDFGIGYEHFISTIKDYGNSGAIMIKLGFNFHSSIGPKKPKIKKIIPTYNSGFELGIEGGGMSDWGGALLLGYKFSPKLSFALGLGGGGITSELSTHSESIRYSEQDGQGDIVESVSRENHYSVERGALKAFLRGQYRLTDKKFSPIGSVDIGYRFNFGSIMYELDVPRSGFFIRPMVGYSMRIGSNSYLEAKVGYEIAPGAPKRDKLTNVDNRSYKSVRNTADRINFSNFAFSLSWKHTFSLFSRN